MPVLNGAATNPFMTRGSVPASSAETQNCDVAIIGAGPVGLFAVFECGMLDMRCAVFDALPAPGGQCAALYPEKPIYDIPGYPRIDAAELVERLVEQASPFAPGFHLGQAVAGLTATAEGFVVENAAGVRVAARAVMVVHRRAKFRAAPQSAAQLRALAEAGRIELVIPYQLQALEGANGQLSAVIVADLAGQTRRLAADCLLPFFGLATDLGPLAAWQLDFDNHRIRVDPATCATSRPGIFAIGDIAAYPGKLKLILSGFAEAALAAHAIHPLVHPGEALRFEYSTMKGLPGR